MPKSSYQIGMDSMRLAREKALNEGWSVYQVPHGKRHPRRPPDGDAWGVVDQFWLKPGIIKLVAVTTGKIREKIKFEMFVYMHQYPLTVLVRKPGTEQFKEVTFRCEDMKKNKKRGGKSADKRGTYSRLHFQPFDLWWKGHRQDWETCPDCGNEHPKSQYCSCKVRDPKLKEVEDDSQRDIEVDPA